jgi:predicted permease
VFLFGKAIAEARQTAMERALGADMFRVVGRRIAEAAILCGAAAAFGSGIAFVWIRVLEAYPPPLAAIVVRPLWDWRVWALTAAWTTAAILIASAAPALLVTRRKQAALQSAPSGPSGAARRIREVMVAVQIAVASVILAATGFILRTVMAAHTTDLGFEPSGLVMAEVELFGLGVDRGQSKRVMQEALARLRDRPEVRQVAAASLMPLTVIRRPSRVEVPSGGSVPAHSNTVSEGYFETLRLPIVRGRVFSGGAAGVSETVVNETLARLLDPGSDVLGKTLGVLNEDAKVGMRLTITGIARDAKYHTLWQDHIPYFYVSTETGAGRTLIVRMRAPEREAFAAIRDTVRGVFPSAIVSAPRNGANQIAGLIREQSYLAAFFGSLGVIALLVAAGGLMAALSVMVSQRTREIGIRQSLGATRGRILGSVAGRGIAIACVGLVLGGAVAWRAQTLLRSLAPGTPEGDFIPVAAAVAMLLVVASLAALGPALRAARIEPWSAIRHPE